MIGTLLVGALLAVATPNDPTSNTNVAALATPAPVAGQVPAAAKPKRYCIKDTLTGSRVPRKLCMTRDQWIARGQDPLAK